MMMNIFGHRGACRREPENTLRSFGRALDDGADGLELDVRLCATGELVVAHDPTFRRRAGDERAVGQMAFADVRRLDVGGGERVPLLDEVLDLARARGALLNVEVKTNGPRGPEVAAALAGRLVEAGVREGVVVSSFDPRALAVVRRRAPGVATGLLFGVRQRWLLRSGLPARIVRATAVHPEHWLVDAARVAAWHRAGRKVAVWTVDDPAELRRLAAIGVDSVITNDPAAARAALRYSSAPSHS